MQPGDVFFTRGDGLVGWVIRHGSGSFYAHVGVLVERCADGDWIVAEALYSSNGLLSGTRLRKRSFVRGELTRFVNVAPDRASRDRFVNVARAAAVKGHRYDLPELLRIAARGVGIRWSRPKSDARICSAVVAEWLVEVWPEFGWFLPVPVLSVWPGLLAHCVDEWQHSVGPVFVDGRRG